MTMANTEKEVNLRTAIESLDPLLAFTGLSFRRQTITNNWRLWVFLSLMLFDLVVQLSCDLFVPYDKRVFMLMGNISAYLLGRKYYYFEPVVWAFKLANFLLLAQHFVFGSGWLRETEHLYAALLDECPQLTLGRTGQLSRVTRQTKLLIVCLIVTYFWCTNLIKNIYDFIGFPHQTFSEWLGMTVQISLPITFYLFIETFFLGLVYLVSRFTSDLAYNFNAFLLNAMANNRVHVLPSCLRIFSMYMELVGKCNGFLLRIYLIYTICFSFHVPLMIFNILYADLVDLIRYFLFGYFVFFASNIVLLSYILGRISTQMNPSTDALYEKIISKQIVIAQPRARQQMRLKYLIFDFFNIVYGNVVNVNVLGQPINMTTCIGLFTIYVTFFSILLANHRSKN